jgi:transketolase
MPISGPYPWLAVADEADARAALGTAELNKDLAAVLAAPEGEAVAKLVQLAHNHGRWITESAKAQAVLKAKDDELAPLLIKLAEIKVAGAKAITDSAKLRGLHHRAMKRPFADVRRDGKFEIGAATAAFWVDAQKALPNAMKKYQQALQPLVQQVGGASEPTAKQKRSAQEDGAKRARSCRNKLTARRKLEAELEKCAFETCAEAKVLGLVASWSDAHTAAQKQLRQVDLALSSVGQSALSEALTRQQGCDVTPW